MFKTLFSIKNIAIIILIVIIVLQNFFIKPNVPVGRTVYIDGKPYEVIRYTVDTVYKYKEKIVFKDGYKIHYDTIYVPIPFNIDTIKIIKDYYTKYVATDSLVLDNKLGIVTVVDTITQNKIKFRKWYSNIRETTISTTTVIKEPARAQLYMGVDGEFNTTNLLNGAAVGLILKTKSDKLYKINIGVADSHIGTFQSGITPYLGIGLYWKLKLKK